MLSVLAGSIISNGHSNAAATPMIATSTSICIQLCGVPAAPLCTPQTMNQVPVAAAIVVKP